MPDATTPKKSIWADCGLQSLVAIVLIIVLTAALLWAQGGAADLSKILTAIIAVILGLFAAVVLAKMFCGPIDLSLLISEADGNASMSRFQFLIFTFVIAASYLALAFKANGATLVDVPNGVLGLLGISGGSYVASKVVQKAAETSQSNTVVNAAAHPAPQANPANPPANPAPI
jgi:hypothetical protein